MNAFNSHVHTRVTRGNGILEKFLAKKRASIANKFIDPALRKGTLLDIGCGSFPHFLLSTQFRKKYGIDLLVHEKQFQFKSNKDVILKGIDIEKDKLPFGGSFFSVVVMLAVLEHINEKGLLALLKEVKRVLEKNGEFIITTPSPWAAPVLWLLSKISIVSKEEIDDHKSAMSQEQIRKILNQAGFSEAKIKSGYFEFFFNMWFVIRK